MGYMHLVFSDSFSFNDGLCGSSQQLNTLQRILPWMLTTADGSCHSWS